MINKSFASTGIVGRIAIAAQLSIGGSFKSSTAGGAGSHAVVGSASDERLCQSQFSRAVCSFVAAAARDLPATGNGNSL